MDEAHASLGLAMKPGQMRGRVQVFDKARRISAEARGDSSAGSFREPLTASPPRRKSRSPHQHFASKFDTLWTW